MSITHYSILYKDFFTAKVRKIVDVELGISLARSIRRLPFGLLAFNVQAGRSLTLLQKLAQLF